MGESFEVVYFIQLFDTLFTLYKITQGQLILIYLL